MQVKRKHKYMGSKTCDSQECHASTARAACSMHGLQCCSPWAGAKESAHFFFSGSLWQFELRSSLGRATQQYDASDCSSTLRRTTLTRPCTKRRFSRYRKL